MSVWVAEPVRAALICGTKNAGDSMQKRRIRDEKMPRLIMRSTLSLLPILFLVCIRNNPGDSSGCDEVWSGVCRCPIRGDSNIKLTYPNGGETVYSGGNDSLRFCVRDSQLLADSCLNTVRAEISLDDGDTWEDITITDRSSGTTTFAWYVTDKHGSSEAILRVIMDFPCGEPAEDFDRSDRSFWIR